MVAVLPPAAVVALKLNHAQPAVPSSEFSAHGFRSWCQSIGQASDLSGTEAKQVQFAGGDGYFPHRSSQLGLRNETVRKVFDTPPGSEELAGSARWQARRLVQPCLFGAC